MSKPPEPIKGQNGRWEKMGEVCVDSGTLAVVDPCYVIDKGEEIYGFTDWKKHYEPYCGKLGVQFSSGFGDGGYDVWAWITTVGSWGERVAEVRVCMITEAEEETNRMDEMMEFWNEAAVTDTP